MLRLETVQAYLRDLKARGKLVTTWNDDTYRQQGHSSDGSYLGRQVEMQDKAGRRRGGADTVRRCALPTGPRIPQRPLDVNPADATAARQEAARPPLRRP